jgi:hypothetical protein
LHVALCGAQCLPDFLFYFSPLSLKTSEHAFIDLADVLSGEAIPARYGPSAPQRGGAQQLRGVSGGEPTGPPPGGPLLRQGHRYDHLDLRFAKAVDMDN